MTHIDQVPVESVSPVLDGANDFSGFPVVQHRVRWADRSGGVFCACYGNGLGLDLSPFNDLLRKLEPRRRARVDPPRQGRP